MNNIDHIIRLNELTSIVGLSKVSIYRLINKGTFPKQIRLGERASGWKSSQIQQWIDEREVA